MQTSDPVPADVVREFLKQAAATPYCRPALRTLGASLPADDSILTAALNEAAAGRDAKSFSHLYFGALFAGRRIPATVLELGAALLPEAMLLLHTELRLQGDIAESLAVAVRSGRMGNEREATALIVGWLDYERREIPAPVEILALTRKICRENIRTGLPLVRSLLCLTAKLSGDPVVATILNADIERDLNLAVSPPVTPRSGKPCAFSNSAQAPCESASRATAACSSKPAPETPCASSISSSAATSTAGSPHTDVEPSSSLSQLPNLTRVGRILRLLRFHIPDLKLKPSITVYQHCSHRLRFSRSGEHLIEEAWSRRFVVVGKRNPFAVNQTESDSPGA